MPEEEYITDEVDGQALPTDAADSTQGEDLSGLTLEELNQTLNKQFPTKEAALKSIKDTYSFVGKKASPVDTSQFLTRGEFEEKEFFLERPELKEYKDAILEMRKPGESIYQVVEKPAFKTLYDKAQGFDEVQKSKSVLQTNPRLGQVHDRLTSAQENLKQGNQSQANRDAVSAVLEAFEQ